MKVTLKKVKEFISKNEVNKLLIETLLESEEFAGVVKVKGKDQFIHIITDSEDLIETTSHLGEFYDNLYNKVQEELDLITLGSKNKA